MCLYFKTKPKRQRAAHDIVVYKIMSVDSEKVNSIHYTNKNGYKLNKIYRASTYYNLALPIFRLYIEKIIGWEFDLYRYKVEAGFYSFATKEIAQRENYSIDTLIECVIPKGAEYIVDNEENPEVLISTKLMFKGEKNVLDR